MNFQKILCISALFLFLYSNAAAQTSPRISWSADNDLLPQNSVKSIAKDKYGYLWLSTENGLVRYDGKNFKIYNSQNLGLKNNRMLTIQGNYASDSLFVTSNLGQDLILIHNRTAVKIDTSKFANHQKYLSTDGRYYNSVGSLPYPIYYKNWDYKIVLPSNNYYVITKEKIQYFEATNQLLDSIACKITKTQYLFAIGEKLFYLKNNHEYAIIEKGKIKWHRLSAKIPSNFRLLWNKTAQQVFLLCDNTFYKLGYKNNDITFKELVSDDQLKYKNIVSTYFDSSRNILFLGSSTSGLGTYRSIGFKTLTYLDDKQSSVFYALVPFTDKTILTSSGFVMSKDAIESSYQFRNSERTVMHLDNNKNIWLKSHYELYNYNSNDQYKKAQIYAFKDRIGTFFQDASKKMWLTIEIGNTNSSSLIYFDSRQNPVFIKYADLNFRVNYMKQSKDGKIWLAGTKGLYLLNKEKNTIKSIKETAELDIRSILETGDDELWIATYGNGFYLYKNSILTRFPLDINGYLATAHLFMEDGKGFFWMTTNKGLFQVKKDILISYANNHQQSIYYHFYNKEAGFLTNEFNGGASPFSAKLGSQFFLPSMNGVVTFDTKKIRPLEPKNPIYIDEITVDNQEIKMGKELYLPNNYQRVTFSFSSPYFGNELNAHYEVKLDGPTNLGWTALAPDHKYSFTKLSAGTYILTARKLSGFDSTFIYKKMTIVIAPLFYQTIWFALLLLLFSSVIIYCAIKMYSNNTKRRNNFLLKRIEEKTKDLQNTISTLRTTKDNMKRQADKNNKLIQIISHDIKSPLKFMSMAGKYMYDDFDPNSPDLKENILAIHTSSSQIYNFLDNILSYSKVNAEDGELENIRIPLHNEIKDKIKLFKNIANARKTQLINSISETLTLNTNESLFAIIVHNLLDNALKHTSNGTIEFSAIQNEGDITMTIKDLGVGMNKETLHYYQSVITDFDQHKNKSNKKLGLHLAIELMLILNGKIVLESQEGKGTTIQLKFSNQAEKVSS
jgi:signal transduction histidine kinase